MHGSQAAGMVSQEAGGVDGGAGGCPGEGGLSQLKGGQAGGAGGDDGNGGGEGDGMTMDSILNVTVPPSLRASVHSRPASFGPIFTVHSPRPSSPAGSSSKPRTLCGGERRGGAKRGRLVRRVSTRHVVMPAQRAHDRIERLCARLSCGVPSKNNIGQVCGALYVPHALPGDSDVSQLGFRESEMVGVLRMRMFCGKAVS